MKYFVTGGAGFIGSNYVNMLLKEAEGVDQVTVLDNFTYAASIRNLEQVVSDSRLKVVRGDICDFSMILEEMSNHDYVIHFAAESHVDRSINDSAVFVKTNVLGTYNLLEAARLNEISTFIHVSTDEVYGSLSEGSAAEDSPLSPNSPYAASKAASDLLVRSYSVTHGLDVRITRCCNNFGPHQYPEKVIPVLVRALKQNKRMPIYGNGLNIREWIYVGDHCRALQLILENGEPGNIYNIGSGIHLTNLELANKIAEHLNIKGQLIEYVPDRKGHDYRYSINSAKINKLGFTLNSHFETDLKKTINWYVETENWWPNLS
jgi:dTDP-glucose 4,6-dehydratase